MKRYAPVIVLLALAVAGCIADSFNGGGGSGGTTVTVAAPYVTIGGTKYVAQTMWPFTAFFSGSFLDANTCTLTAGTNGSELFACALNTVNSWYSVAATTSVEAEFVPGGSTMTATSNNFTDSGIWICDSTNSTLYNFEVTNFTTATAGSDSRWLTTSSWTLASCAGTPSAGTNRVAQSMTYPGGLIHLKLVKSGSNLLFDVSYDAGQTYIQIDSVAVGTLSNGGVSTRSGGNFTVYNSILSIAVN